MARTSRNDWLDEGLDALRDGGEGALTIDGLEPILLASEIFCAPAIHSAAVSVAYGRLYLGARSEDERRPNLLVATLTGGRTSGASAGIGTARFHCPPPQAPRSRTRSRTVAP
ncbi:hypothetical protein BE21_29535 [Sorangium cellulosum]|uniref:Uncharacterized protein n=1 Tax=Sorangium cellulosum TaxID=56 RepID=A0A150TS43_SORCE|nr:hypothetical protein BE21_29535 [Sorangium cellulosum]